MSEPTSADVRAATEALALFIEDVAMVGLQTPSLQSAQAENAAKARIHARSALALLTERLARLEAELAQWPEVADRGKRDAVDALTDRMVVALRKYGGHLDSCALFARNVEDGCYTPRPCDCGLAALLPPATEGR